MPGESFFGKDDYHDWCQGGGGLVGFDDPNCSVENKKSKGLGSTLAQSGSVQPGPVSQLYNNFKLTIQM